MFCCNISGRLAESLFFGWFLLLNLQLCGSSMIDSSEVSREGAGTSSIPALSLAAAAETKCALRERERRERREGKRHPSTVSARRRRRSELT